MESIQLVQDFVDHFADRVTHTLLRDVELAELMHQFVHQRSFPHADPVVEQEQIGEAARILQDAPRRMARAFQLLHLRDQLICNAEELLVDLLVVSGVIVSKM